MREGEYGRWWLGQLGGVVDGEVERGGEGVQMVSSRRQGRIRLLRARPRWEGLLIGRGRVVGE